MYLFCLQKVLCGQYEPKWVWNPWCFAHFQTMSVIQKVLYLALANSVFLQFSLLCFSPVELFLGL